MWRFLAIYHSCSILFVGYTFIRFRAYKQLPKSATERFALLTSIQDSVPTVSIVAATIIFFSTIHSIIAHLTQNETFTLLTAILLEMTTALSLAAEIDSSLRATAIVFILTLQSLSIHTQVAIIAQQAQLSLIPYGIQRLLMLVAVPLLFYFSGQ